MAKKWREAICPVCGTSHGMVGIPLPDKPYIKLEQESYWDRLQRNVGEEHFGVIKSSEGRGTMKFEGYYEKDGDVEGFLPVIKARVFHAIQRGLADGWWTPAEIRKLLRD